MIDLVSMPVSMIRYLDDTLQQTSGKKEADFAVYQLGRKWGRETVKISGEGCNMDELAVKTTLTAVHSGITNLEVSIDEDIIITPYDSKIDNDFFIAGYVSGVVSELMGEEYIANIEDEHLRLVKPEKTAQERISKHLEDKGERIEGSGLKGIKKGESYIVPEDDRNASVSFDIFLNGLDIDIPGLCFTRIFPPKIRDKSEGHDFPIFWLSTVGSSDDINTIKPIEYKNKIYKIISSFLEAKEGIVMLHGLEFLVSNHGFKEVFKFLQKLRDMTAVNDGIFILPVRPSALDEKDYNNLKSEFTLYAR